MPDQVIKAALERFKQSNDGSSYNRDAARLDIAFSRLGDQWPDAVRKTREAEGRPCLTINRLPTFIRQVVNDARQNSPAIQVVPVDSSGDPDTAQVIGGLIKAIERGSNASVAYDTALEQAVTGGFGFFRITTDYVHPESFDMEARIERIANPFSVYWDTNSTKFDASDWEYAFVSDLLTEAEFKRKYPQAKAVSWENGAGDDNAALWLDGPKVRIAEYWEKIERKRKILLLSDGRVIEEDDAKEPIMLPDGRMLPALEALAMAGIVVARERESEYCEVKRRTISGVEVLSEDEWPGSTIPICPVWGEEVVYEGRRWFRSLVRDAKEPQQMLNFWRSASTELVALAPRAPFVMSERSLPRDSAEKQKWLSANTRSHAYLLYNGDGPPPQRQPFAGVPAGALQEAMNATDDMKSVMGLYDASLGARSNETSGRAILARQREGDTSTFHFIDNLSRAIQYAGRCLVEIIPSIYSQRQAIQILGPDDAAKVVRLSQEGGPVEPDESGEKLYNLNVGKYDVTVKTGPSFTTQREETRQALTEIVQAGGPQLVPLLGDVIVKLMDFPDAERYARRLRALLPPEVRQAEDGETMQNLPPEAQAAVMSAQSQVAQLQQQLQQAMQMAEGKMADAQARAAEAQGRAQADAVKAQAQAAADAEKARLEAEIEAAKISAENARAQAEIDAKVYAARLNAAVQLLKDQQAGAMAAEGDARRQAETQAINGDIMARLDQVAQMIAAPRILVRDEAGRPVGSQMAGMQ